MSGLPGTHSQSFGAVQALGGDRLVDQWFQVGGWAGRGWLVWPGRAQAANADCGMSSLLVTPASLPCSASSSTEADQPAAA